MNEFSAEWLAWQREHTAALEALQQAQRTYHRTLADTAFTNPAAERPEDALEQLEAARVRLDGVRARRPE